MSPPKIAFNGTYIQQQASGLGVVNQNLIAELIEDRSSAENTPCDRPLEWWICSQGSFPQHPRVIPVSSNLSPDRGFSAHLKRIFWYQTTLKQQLRQQQIDLFFSPVYEGMFFPAIPQIVTVHDLIPLKYPQLSPKWKYYYKYALPFLLKQSQRVICVSESTKRDVVANYYLDPASIDVVYNGYDRSTFFPQPDPQILQKYNLGKYLLYVGDMRFYKNLDRCLEAFDRLSLKDYQFVVAGNKDDFFYPQIERRVRQLSARERIIFLDYVPTADLTRLYSMAQCLVFASLYEGFGLPVLEAMACGCPVITAKSTSLPEVGGDSVLYADPERVEDLTQQMYRLLTDRQLQATLRERGFKRSQLFSWQKTADEIRNICVNLLDKLASK